jgi:hypothetical protein
MAPTYRPATGHIYLGFTNSIGYFDEIDFMRDKVIGQLHPVSERYRAGTLTLFVRITPSPD